MRQRSGFALTELVIVVAIIGVPAAILFPTCARARETALSAQCVTHTKAITAAVRMRVADHGRFFPSEHDRRVIDYFNARGDVTWPDVCRHVHQANPYLRPAVILSRCLLKSPPFPRVYSQSLCSCWPGNGVMS